MPELRNTPQVFFSKMIMPSVAKSSLGVCADNHGMNLKRDLVTQFQCVYSCCVNHSPVQTLMNSPSQQAASCQGALDQEIRFISLSLALNHKYMGFVKSNRKLLSSHACIQQLLLF